MCGEGDLAAWLSRLDAALELLEQTRRPDAVFEFLREACGADSVALAESDTRTRDDRILSTTIECDAFDPVRRPGGLTALCGSVAGEVIQVRDRAHASGTLHDELVVNLLRRGSRIVALRIASRRQYFTEKVVATVQILGPHIARAFRQNAIKADLWRQSEVRSGLLDVFFPWGLIVLTQERRVFFTNASARRLLNANDGLSIADSIVRVSRRSEARRLKELLDRSVSIEESSEFEIVGCLRVSRPTGLRDLTLVCARIRVEESFLEGGSVSVLLIADPEQEPAVSQPRLRELFGMTPSEARVSSLLVKGYTLKEISRDLGVTLNTCRAHVGRALSKSGVGRQADLMKLLLTSPISRPVLTKD